MILKMKRCLNKNFSVNFCQVKVINQLKGPTHYSEICKTKGKNQACTLFLLFFSFWNRNSLQKIPANECGNDKLRSPTFGTTDQIMDLSNSY